VANGSPPVRVTVPMKRMAANDDAWAEAADELLAGGVVALPTDTVYGVAASIHQPAAVVRLFALKDREASKPVAVLVSGPEQAAEIAQWSLMAATLAGRFWPGPLTMVLPRLDDFDLDLGGAGETVGVRCPGHEPLAALCARVGPLATTSANRSGAPTPDDGGGVADELASTAVSLLIDGGVSGGFVPSTVARVEDDELTILREGPITEADLRSVS
jgi:L-threonylcarbamoyladenylate synthase